MVDQRAETPGIGFAGPDGGAWRAGWLTRFTDRLAAQLGLDSDSAAGQFLLPVIVSGVWLLALGAYGIGYFDRLDADLAAGASRALPTLDLMFFAFAAIGPVLMLWMVVLLHARAARLSDALTAQSDSALALAATVASLHEAVETLSAGTTDKVADAAAAVERDSAAAMARLDGSLAEMADRLDTGMVDAVLMLDRNLRERTARADAALDAQREALGRRLDDAAEHLARMIEAQARGLEAAQRLLGERIEEALSAHGRRLEDGTDALFKALQGRLAGIGGRVDETLTQLASELATAQRNRNRELDADMRQRELRLQGAVEEVARFIEGGVAPLLGELRVALAETREAIACNPPASAEALSRLLGEAAKREVAPERAALTDAVARLGALEEQAQRLLSDIDRTARLNPHMEPTASEAAPAAAPPVSELPFPALPRGAGRSALNWTAAIHALDGRPAGEARRRIVDRAAADPDVAALRGLTTDIARALAEDGLHLADVRPVHASAALWHRFALGERGDDMVELAGIEDDISLAIARARLRDDPAFRATALRLVEVYTRLVGRAAAETGPDPRLVELAETPPGRAFILLAELTHAFRPVPVTAG